MKPTDIESPELTDAERALLTPFDFIACMIFFERAKHRHEIPPTWLAASDEAREDARFSVRLTMMATDAQIAEKVADDPKLKHAFEVWVQAETDFRAGRMENPRMFFAEYACP